MRLLKTGLVSGIERMNIDQETCEICVKAKQSRETFRYSGKRANNVLDLIHSDICGPMRNTSISGARYFITFIDDHTRKMFIYPLKRKGEAFNAFCKFKALVENEMGRKIRILRSDNGKEYVNQEFRTFLEKNGIRHQTTIPYNPEQNGLAERELTEP